MNFIGKAFIALHIKIFRGSGGKRMSSFGATRMLLLTTKGKKTGLSRTVPVAYIEDEQGNPVVTASAGGAPKHPAWYTNLEANPEVTVELPGQTYQARVEIAAPALREKLWATLIAKHANFAGYQKKTTRVIPMVILRRAA